MRETRRFRAFVRSFTQLVETQGESEEIVLCDGGQQRLAPGSVDLLSPAEGDIHEVTNAFEDRVSISIHVYGGNIGAVERHVFDATTGAAKPFVSGYSSPFLPNFWDRSAEVRASMASRTT